MPPTTKKTAPQISCTRIWTNLDLHNFENPSTPTHMKTYAAGIRMQDMAWKEIAASQMLDMPYRQTIIVIAGMTMLVCTNALCSLDLARSSSATPGSW